MTTKVKHACIVAYTMHEFTKSLDEHSEKLHVFASQTHVNVVTDIMGTQKWIFTAVLYYRVEE